MELVENPWTTTVSLNLFQDRFLPGAVELLCRPQVMEYKQNTSYAMKSTGQFSDLFMIRYILSGLQWSIDSSLVWFGGHSST